MARKARLSKGKVMRPNFFVFCEGDTEVAYVEMLRSHYRMPIHIIARKTHLNITSELVERCKAAYIQTKDDKTFLMYDLDVPSMLVRLKTIANAILLCSNPCFELWLLLHYGEVERELISAECLKRLFRFEERYKKGAISGAMQQFLFANINSAMQRANKLCAYQNPSTTVYRLIEELDAAKIT